MKYETLFQSLGKKLDNSIEQFEEIVDKIPEFYKKNIEEPVEKFIKEIESSIEDSDPKELIVTLKGSFDENETTIAIGEENTIDIFFGESLKKRIQYSENVNIFNSNFLFEKDKLIIKSPFKKTPISQADKIVQVINY